MNTLLNFLLEAQNNATIASTSQTDNRTKIVLIIMGILLLILGVTVFLFYTVTSRKMKEFKQKQLEQYRINHPKKKHLSYDQTGLYVPSWERAKYQSPLIIGLVLCIIGISFITSQLA